jgi:hypothetical protein
MSDTNTQKYSREISGAVGEFEVAKQLTINGFRIYLPYQGNNANDDFAVVNEKSGNVYRIQVKTKQDTKPWSSMYFKNINEICHKSLFFVLHEITTSSFFIVPSEDLAKADTDKNSFNTNEETVCKKYCNKWNLLK